MRIQILELPTVVVGEQVTTPFALIVDQVTDPVPVERVAPTFIQDVGARACWITNETVEIVQ